MIYIEKNACFCCLFIFENFVSGSAIRLLLFGSKTLSEVTGCIKPNHFKPSDFITASGTSATIYRETISR